MIDAWVTVLDIGVTIWLIVFVGLTIWVCIDYIRGKHK